MHSLAGTVARFLQPLDCSRGIVVAVSGGPDSVALLRLLLEQEPPLPLLVMAHLNHQLRGAESDCDEAFVRRLHESICPAAPTRVELRCEKLDVAARAKIAGDNLENVARAVRYEWLLRVANDFGAGLIATGHTANDQAETVLHRLLRGSGLRGLRGIAARRALAPGVEVIRPLLGAIRDELLSYLAERGQTFRVDRSNTDVRWTRNRIRHELLPLLAERYNPEVVSVLGRLAKQANEIYCELESAGRRLLAEAERPKVGRVVVLDCKALAAAPRNTVREAFRFVWERENWPTGEMTFDSWDRLASVAAGDLSSVDLPGGLRALRRGRVVQVGPAS